MKRLLFILLGTILMLNLVACAQTSAEDRMADITVNNEAASIDASGTLTISSGGTYELTGTLDGQIWVDAKGEDVTLVLNGVDIESSHSSAIYVKKAASVTIELAEGSENVLSDANEYVYDDAAEEEPDGTLFSKADLILKGAGSLTIEANHSYAVRGKDALVIEGGTYALTAADTAIRANDSVTISGGNLMITAENDGIRASNETDESLGWVCVSGGTIDITSACDGIQAETGLTITGGELRITTNGSTGEDASVKGLKAGGDITISGATLTLDTADDGIHAGGDISVTDSTVSIASDDDGMHADANLTISGGTVAVTRSYEGLEGKSVLISGGDIHVTASDDGLNAGGGADGSSFGRWGANTFADSGEYSLEISGGYVVIDAQGDGIDSNGDLTISGGVTLVSGPTNNGNGAMDSGEGSAFTVTGGVLIAAGSSGMTEVPGSTSTQNSISVGTSGAGGTLFSILDADGNALYAFTPGKNYENVLISAPEITTGMTYTATIGGTADGLNEDGYQKAGTVSGGESVGSATISSYLASIGNGSTGGGFGGMNNWNDRPGGQRPKN